MVELRHKIDFAKINSVSANDIGFSNLLEAIKSYAGVENISFTTGPKRGEIVWAEM